MAKLDQMTAMLRSQQEALSKFAMENVTLKLAMEGLKEEVSLLRTEMADFKSAEKEIATPDDPSNPDDRLDSNLCVSSNKLCV